MIEVGLVEVGIFAKHGRSQTHFGKLWKIEGLDRRCPTACLFFGG